MPTYFTSQIPTFVAVSSESSVVIRLYRAQNVVFETTLYTYMSRALVRDLRSVIEQDLRNANICTDLYELTQDDHNEVKTIEQFSAIYCKNHINLPADEFLKTHFLTTISSKMSSRISDTLAYLAWANENVYLSRYVVYRDGSGNNNVYKETPVLMTSDGYAHFITTNPNDYASYGKILSITVTLNERSFTYYYVDDKPSFSACFRNSFNVLELIQLPGVTKQSTKIERSEAVLQHRTTFYDQSVVDAFEFQSAPLPYALSKHASELSTSNEVYLVDREFEDLDELPQILITDSDISASNKRGELSSIKFTYRYDDDVIHTYIPNVPAQPFNNTYQLPYT